jgi:hypothetical protein
VTTIRDLDRDARRQRRLKQLRSALEKVQARDKSLGERIGCLMSQRVDCEERGAEILDEIERMERGGI